MVHVGQFTRSDRWVAHLVIREKAQKAVEGLAIGSHHVLVSRIGAFSAPPVVKKAISLHLDQSLLVLAEEPQARERKATDAIEPSRLRPGSVGERVLARWEGILDARPIQAGMG